MAIERRPITDRDAWLEWRKLDATASEIGAIAGVDRFKTRLRVHLEKRGVEFPRGEAAGPMLFGSMFEGVVAKVAAQERPQWKIIPGETYWRDPEARIGGTPDFLIEGDPRGLGVLQVKTCGTSAWERTWDCGRGDLPEHIELQVHTEMMLADAAFGAVAVWVQDFYRWTFQIIDCLARDPGEEAKIRELVREFWAEVDEGRQPEPDFATDGESIKALAGRGNPGKGIDLSGHNEIREMLAHRARIEARMKMDASRSETIENHIKYLMGDAEYATGLPEWKISFRSYDRAGYTVRPKLGIRPLKITDRRPAHEKPDIDDEDFFAEPSEMDA